MCVPESDLLARKKSLIIISAPPENETEKSFSHAVGYVIGDFVRSCWLGASGKRNALLATEKIRREGLVDMRTA